MKLTVPITADSNFIPSHATPGSAGMDLRSREHVRINPGEVVKVATGVRVAVPEGYAMLILPRSGLASNGITVANAPGLVDSDYRGEVCVLLRNQSSTVWPIMFGERIAQAVFVAVPQVEWQVVPALDGTERGAGGFGSTGA